MNFTHTKQGRLRRKLMTFLLLMSLSIAARAADQGDIKLTLSVTDVPLSKVFKIIEKESGFTFLYNSELIHNANVSIKVKDTGLDDVLKRLLEPQHIEWEYRDKTIVLRPQSSKKTPVFSLADTLTTSSIRGRVVDDNGSPLPGATVIVKGSNKGVVTDQAGEFIFQDVDRNSTAIITFTGFGAKEVKLNRKYLVIPLEQVQNSIKEVQIASSGYQRLPKERINGSIAFINNELVNRRVSPDILSRLEGITPGLLFNRNTAASLNGTLDISIRGRNTLFASSQPLIVVDNFPYDGDINNINPNDVESITVLKDASAASIWGVKSGNGVIVIATKRGSRDQKRVVEVNSNITIGQKPDLFYGPGFIKSTDFIDLEEDLFQRGYYNGDLNTQYNVVSPVVALLAKVNAGLISQADANRQINALRNNDSRNDLSKYFYQKSVNQQYSINIRGGNVNSDYFISMGYDKGVSSQKGNSNTRVVINTLYNLRLFKGFDFSAATNYVVNNIWNNSIVGQINAGSKGLLPYAKVVDNKGDALSIVKNYSDAYTDTVGGGALLDWKYRPLDELKNADNLTKLNEARINLGLKYSFLPDFSLELKYQLEKANTYGANYYSLATYRARDLINRYTQFLTTGSVSSIPLGGVLNQNVSNLVSQRLRTQLNYSHNWQFIHEINGILGAEVSDVVVDGNNMTLYGYDKSTATSQLIDPIANYSTLPSNSIEKIPFSNNISKSTDRYVSYFGNVAYSLKGVYTLSASGRVDKSNLFGVNTNQKSVPLYSLGVGWNFSKESFYHVSWLPYGKIRVTYGYNGNVNKSVSALTTFSTGSSTTPYYGIPGAQINTPGNPELRWEKVKVVNLGLDFATVNQRISGSIEYYWKKGIDLFGDAPLPGSTGFPTYRGNTSSTEGHGVDVVVTSKNIYKENFSWTTSFILSNVIDRVTKYDVKYNATNFINTASGNNFSILPVVGKPIYAIYSYKWEGLDSKSGDPLGYVDGKVTSNWGKIISGTATDSLIYNGPSRPTVFGSIRNSFNYRRLSLSFNFIYKINYYFRRASVNYIGLFQGWNMNSDYYSRWQKTGDEHNTNVPSISYSTYENGRNTFYSNSDVLVEKGDHIRFQDVTVSYNFDNALLKKAGFTQLQLYSYVNNVGIIWRKNSRHLDPDLYGNNMPAPRTYSIGIKAIF